jgi:hypothetical protein
MQARHRIVSVVLFAIVASLIGCDTVERARTRFGRTTTDTVITASGTGLSLGLQVPPTLRPGDEAVLRLSLNNFADTAVSQVRVELILPGWAEAMPPRIGDRPVTLSALGDGTTLFAYRMDDAPIEPKRGRTVEQRIRVPASGTSGGAGGSTRAVRARLLTLDGRPLAQVESQFAIEGAAVANAAAPQPNARGADIKASTEGENVMAPTVLPASPPHLIIDDCRDLVLFDVPDTSTDAQSGVVTLRWTEVPDKQRSLTILARSPSCAAHDGVKRLVQPNN